ncbi:MAG: hydantoinase B/oxoprolinase family protein, partial [Nitrospinota bacterium]
DQMGHILERTASSTNIKERRDFSCGVFDSDGGLIASAPHIPVHLGAMGESVKSVLKTRGPSMSPGDVLLTNDPFNGGSHLPDITVVSPFFDKDGKKILFLVASRGHHADIGGTSPGSMPANSQNIAEEGILFENEFLMRKGVFLEEEIGKKLKSGPYPARNITENIADLKAQVAANNKGIDELKEVLGEYGPGMVTMYTRFIQQNAEEAVRRVIGKLEPGRFIDSLCVQISVDKKNRSATIDFSGTSKQSPGNMNAPVAVTYAAVIYVFRTLIDEKIPLNSGFLAPFTILIPDDSLLNPKNPAAVAGGNVEVSMRLVDVLYGALKTMGAGQGTMNNFTFGNERVQYYETIAGGTGAGDGFDGESGVHTHMTNTKITDPEILEWKYPVTLHEFSFRKKSGGSGKYRGGNGLKRHVEFHEEMEVGILSDRRKAEPYGMSGGGPGALGKNLLLRKNGELEKLKGKVSLKVLPGDAIIIETPGGGGFGKELKSDPRF